MNIIIPCIIPPISKLKLLYRAKLFALVTISANIKLDGINKKGFANARICKRANVEKCNSKKD